MKQFIKSSLPLSSAYRGGRGDSGSGTALSGSKADSSEGHGDAGSTHDVVLDQVYQDYWYEQRV